MVLKELFPELFIINIFLQKIDILGKTVVIESEEQLCSSYKSNDCKETENCII